VARPRFPRPALLVEVTHGLPITSKPGRGHQVGSMPSASPQFGFGTYAWVLSVSPNGRYGRVPVPYSSRGGTGWIALRGLHRLHTKISVHADLSRHQITVERLGRVILRMKAATGAAWTPTPTGRYFVTDLVPFSRGSSYGSFAFGISNYQYRLPAGWHGGSQLAIHGTNDPGSIGRSVSAGCLRVSERSLALLKPLLRLGTPVVIRP
jgi:lipoprotein-anchoring transpeptidase ErfK/SrfK